MSDTTTYHKSDRSGENIDSLLDYLDGDVRGKIAEFDTALPLKANNSEVVKTETKNQPNGYAGLDENGMINPECIAVDVATKNDIQSIVDEISSVFDELHTYAEGLISGGAE